MKTITRNKVITAVLTVITALVLIIMLSNGIKAEAATYTDTEPNNTYNDAQAISRNTQTPMQFHSSRSNNYRDVTGTLSHDDEDWYSVYLYSDDENYLDLNSGYGTIIVSVYRSSDIDNPIDEYEFQKYGTEIVEVNVPTDGVYYLRVHHTVVSRDATYTFTIGNPRYYTDVYTYTFNAITLQPRATWSDTINLGTISGIPEKAIGYEVSVGGCTTSVSSKRYFYNDFFNNWVSTKSTYNYSLPVTDSSRLDQTWGAKIISTSSSSKTFSPNLTIRYIAPYLP